MKVRKLVLIMGIVLASALALAAVMSLIKGWNAHEWGTLIIAFGGFLIAFGLFSFGGNTSRGLAGTTGQPNMVNMLYWQAEIAAHGGNSESFRRTLHVRGGSSAFRWVTFLAGPALLGLGGLIRGLTG